MREEVIGTILRLSNEYEQHEKECGQDDGFNHRDRLI